MRKIKKILESVPIKINWADRFRKQTEAKTQDFINNLQEVPMPEQHGTKHIKGIIDALGDIVEIGVNAFKDGVQITDVRFIPSAIGKITKIFGLFPNAIKEIKDLSMEEIGEVIGVFVERLVDLFGKLSANPAK